MSFNAKNLHYEKQEPAFLRRLKGAQNAADGRNNVQIARPKKDRLKTGDGDEDEPIIVDENGEVVGKAAFEGMQNGEITATETNSNNQPHAKTQDTASPRDSQQVAEVGGSKKRKQVKVIGGESGDEADSISRKDKVSTNTTKGSEQALHKHEPPLKDDGRKIKKKAKKIKLSFEEPE